MKKLILIFSALLLTGCSIQKSCPAYSDQQCDEMYPYYNCVKSEAYTYTPKKYFQWIGNNSYTPGWNTYYPNTQTIYYVPVPSTQSNPVDNRPVLYNTPRPGSSTTFRERKPKPVNKPTRTRRE